jgi:hypothetical protein
MKLIKSIGNYKIVQGDIKYMDTYKEIATELFSESQYWPTININKIAGWIYQSIERGDGYDRVILDENNNVAGCMSVIATDDAMSDEKTTFDVAIMLCKPYRKNRNAVLCLDKIIAGFMEWSLEKNIPWVRLGNSLGIANDNSISKLFARHGLAPIGIMYGFRKLENT